MKTLSSTLFSDGQGKESTGCIVRFVEVPLKITFSKKWRKLNIYVSKEEKKTRKQEKKKKKKTRKRKERKRKEKKRQKNDNMNLQIGLSSKTVDLVGVGERFRFKKNSAFSSHAKQHQFTLPTCMTQ
ncbi:predicted protein [Lodderomyces elongisporus NRRL YB-4239]|uniref:Uncharacterized protein n=1 Tax=Lodderomyces elongisporus (strain ATCC 11503 / CBS 2605 / JCM 1781 / NBRC 1676 / NRRL YB-4239) TaxID=379508 RepID=A5DWW7_LODEL|nr:predicted protein [Lodderomyces elongisporus NRRL YB-4239]